jgi:arginine decarboxylase
VPTLHSFNFGGGTPTSAYTLNFAFDYAGFLRRLMEQIAATCAIFDVPQPDVIGEFGRYTVASHSVYLLEVGAVKNSQATEASGAGVQAEPWYLINGSLMVSLPDALIVDGQQFVVLPLDRWEAPAQGVRLGGRRTCDSDDFFPRPSEPALVLPEDGQGLVLAILGVGAYQQMISGRGGAHHCLSPEMRRIIVEQDGDALVVREVAPQSLGAIMGLLGYNTEALEPVARPLPSQVERKPVREPIRVTRVSRRRQFVPRSRSLALREARGAQRAA